MLSVADSGTRAARFEPPLVASGLPTQLNLVGPILMVVDAGSILS